MHPWLGPAPMSGGNAVNDRTEVEGDHPVCTSEARKTGDTTLSARQGSGLDGREPAGSKL
jgi:hypothetical protein